MRSGSSAELTGERTHMNWRKHFYLTVTSCCFIDPNKNILSNNGYGKWEVDSKNNLLTQFSGILYRTYQQCTAHERNSEATDPTMTHHNLEAAEYINLLNFVDYLHHCSLEITQAICTILLYLSLLPVLMSNLDCLVSLELLKIKSP